MRRMEGRESCGTRCRSLTRVEREGRKERMERKILNYRWCNSKDILRSKCCSFRTGSPPWAVSICTFLASMGPEHLYILGEVLESTVYPFLDAEPFL